MALINPLFDEKSVNIETASRNTEEAFTLNISCWAGPPGEPPIPITFDSMTRTVLPDLKRL